MNYERLGEKAFVFPATYLLVLIFLFLEFEMERSFFWTS